MSYYHHLKIRGLVCSFQKFAQHFKSGIVPFQPTFEHILSAWDKRDSLNLFFTMFEDMKTDLDSVVDNLVKFLGKNLTLDQKRQIIASVDIESFRQDKLVNF